ncbi:uncharacterized protein LOC115882918 isoform X2 [Sitophilus oryzae]|uniref:Uncharacterized protein LOC115882918 isoform X2 n=1 Tax=Sitophilus oryzae TaxID=7048 RepID=A0A6J2XZZ6_SITOR|nr:uncharacterized protein LOC115882918 isoform X2 [Sitophilus oryzae]
MVKYRGGRSQRIMDACRRLSFESAKRTDINADEIPVSKPVSNEYHTSYNSLDNPGDDGSVLLSVEMDEQLVEDIYIQDDHPSGSYKDEIDIEVLTVSGEGVEIAQHNATIKENYIQSEHSMSEHDNKRDDETKETLSDENRTHTFNLKNPKKLDINKNLGNLENYDKDVTTHDGSIGIENPGMEVEVNNHKLDDNVERDPDYIASGNSDDSIRSSNSQSNNIKPYAVKKVRQRKSNRNLGKTYLTARGKTVPSRILKPLRDNCRNKCKNVLSDKIRNTIFEEYWSLGSHDRRVAFIAGLVGIQEKNITRKKIEGRPTKNRINTYKYKFIIHGEEISVCKTCFCNTLGETEKFITCAMQNKLSSISGITHEDLRGKAAPPHKTPQYKIDEVIKHINSFPAYKSHYSRRHSNKKYLSSELNINIMYKLYCEEYREKPVSLNIYSRLFHTLDLKFKKPKNDTCTKCDTFAAREKYAEHENEKMQYRRELEEHQIAADKAYNSKQIDKQKGLLDNSCVTYAFDLQQVLPTPFLTTNKMFYLRQLSTYNLTVHNCINGKSSHFMWPECTGSRGANEIASCLYRFLKDIPNGIEHAIFYSDTCGGQNKNINVISMFQYSIHLHPTLKIIDHKFLIPGHTHLECDVDHSVIERAKKKTAFEIHVPIDWYQLVRNASKKNYFSVYPMEIEHFYAFSDINTRGPLQKKLILN